MTCELIQTLGEKCVLLRHSSHILNPSDSSKNAGSDQRGKTMAAARPVETAVLL